MQIEKVKISDLSPAEYNPRVRLRPGDAEYEKLKRSIQTFGYIDPIIINADGTIIGGHQRYFILQELGYEEIDVVKLDLDENEERALNVALNKIMAITAINCCMIKRKPIDNVEGEIECPACGMSIDEFDSERYCFNCGQALDWGEGKADG